MGEDPRDIQGQIEETREQMGGTVQALAHKADVPGRIKGSVADTKDTMADKAQAARGRISDTASAGASASGDVAGRTVRKARRGVGMAQENPLGLAVGSVAAGFLLGLAFPSTKAEDERLGPVADQVKEGAREVGGEAVEHGKDLAQDVAQTAAEAARESGREHAEELRESVSQRTPPA